MSQNPTSRRSLTARQRQWLEHLETWKDQQTSLKDYATAHGLSVSGLYSARRLLKRRGYRDTEDGHDARRPEATLVPVRVAPLAPAMPSMIRVTLPHGVVVEVPEHVDPDRLRGVLSALVGAGA